MLPENHKIFVIYWTVQTKVMTVLNLYGAIIIEAHNLSSCLLAYIQYLYNIIIDLSLFFFFIEDTVLIIYLAMAWFSILLSFALLLSYRKLS